MTDRTVSVVLQAKVNSYLASMSAAGRATSDLANKVDAAKGKAAQGFHLIGVAGVAMGTVVAGGYALALKSAADFESKMALVRSLSHATSAEMQQLSDAALHVGQAYGYSAGQVADAEAELVKAGLSVQQILGGALTGALTLAAAGQEDVAQATQTAAIAMTQFGLSGKDVPHIADLLAAGADKAIGSVADLSAGLESGGLVAAQFGLSVDDTIATLAEFAQAGLTGERGGTVLRQMFLQLTSPSKQAADIMRQLGIQVYDASGQFVGMANLAGQLHDKLGNATQATRDHALAVIFGAHAIQGANVLLHDGAAGWQAWHDQTQDAGFAAQQAAGKLDSLSGDVTKLHTALQTAFIEAGESSQGPLRTMVQDVTKAVEVWNELPGPVKEGTEALVLAGGAVTLLGGAALLAVPKIVAYREALASLNTTTAGLARGGLSRTAGFLTGPWGAALTVATVGLGVWANKSAEARAQIDELTTSIQADSGALGANTRAVVVNRLQHEGLLDMARKSGIALSTVTDAALGNADAMRQVQETSSHQVTQAGRFAVTDALAGGVQKLAEQTREAQQAAKDHAAAMGTEGQAASGAAGKVAAAGAAAAGAAKKTRSAADAAKHYSDTLHALADPLFAMNQAMQGVVDAQHAVNVAVRKFGQDSPQARQANLDMASSALDAEAAARTLAASVAHGDTTLQKARRALRAWADDGLLTKKSADDVVTSFDYLIGRAEKISNLHPHLKVTADTSQPEAALSHLAEHIGQVIGDFFSLDSAVSKSGSSTGGPGSNPVTYMPPGSTSGGGGGSKSSGGGSTSDYYTSSSSGTGGGTGAGSGGSGSTRERPPTVQEIVHAILTGTIPPSIDKLSHVLQTEIRHLSTTVSNAEQYRTSMRSNLLGYASLSNATAPTDIYGRQMGAAKVNSYLKGRYAQLKQFMHLHQRLEHAGAGEGLMQEFEEIGPDANPMMRQLLASGRHAVRRASRLEDRVSHLANRAASEAATDRYGPQIVHELRRLPEQDARALVKALRHEHIDVSLKDVAQARGRRVRNKS